MVPFEHLLLQTLQFHFLLFWTLFYNCSLYLVLPSFPVGSLCLLLLLRGIDDLDGCLWLLLLWLGFVVRLGVVFLGWSECSPVFVHFADAAGMFFVVISPKSHWTIDTNKCRGSAPSHHVLIALIFFQGSVAILTNKSHHLTVVDFLLLFTLFQLNKFTVFHLTKL